ncbi:MAG: hypothetical protein WBK55_08630 [Alphaproteobacteria bacterium]|jgi:hypothetical protein|nr:hypothetical protein [Micavibrio sp.]MBK9562924.1 hypothetical protein [Micavibrio sp.]
MATFEIRQYLDKETGKNRKRIRVKIRLKGFAPEEATFDDLTYARTGDHQWLDDAVLRVHQKDGAWVIKGGINGPEYDHTRATLGSMQEMSSDQAHDKAEDALSHALKKCQRMHALEVLKSIGTRIELGRLLTKPDDFEPG